MADQKRLTVEPEEVIAFWIGEAAEDAGLARTKSASWFGGSFALDVQIADRFLDLLATLPDGLAQDWAMRGPRGRLAAIIALDQFPRNLFRGMPGAFEQDDLALSLSLLGQALLVDQSLSEVERAFFYMPMQHSEDADIQARSVGAYTDLFETARPAFRDLAANWLDFAIKHRDVIDQFGRFPHRNAVLQRASTEEEIAWLEAGGGF